MLVVFLQAITFINNDKIYFMEHTRSKKQQIPGKSFELTINNRLYEVNATPFAVATGDILYRVSYNNGPVHVFGWDEGLDRFAETDKLADEIPPVVEMQIASKLNEFANEMQDAA